MNTNIAAVNEIAEAASLLASRAANLAVMTALTDAWNTLTGQQKRDFTENVGNYDQAAVAISIEGDSARLVDDEWHETIHTANGSAADTYERAVETALRSIDTGAQYLGETWDGADPEGRRLLPAPLLHEGATLTPPETCARSQQTTWRSSSPPTKRNTGRLASKRVASGKPQHARGLPAHRIRAGHKKNKHPPGNTDPGGRPLSRPRYSPISGKPAKRCSAGKKKNEREKGEHK